MLVYTTEFEGASVYGTARRALEASIEMGEWKAYDASNEKYFELNAQTIKKAIALVNKNGYLTMRNGQNNNVVSRQLVK